MSSGHCVASVSSNTVWCITRISSSLYRAIFVSLQYFSISTGNKFDFSGGHCQGCRSNRGGEGCQEWFCFIKDIHLQTGRPTLARDIQKTSISNQFLVLLLARLSSTGQMANIFFHYQALCWIQTNDENINSPGSWSLKPPAISPPREILFKWTRKVGIIE